MKFKEISVKELRSKISNSNKPYIIDVREPYEFEEGSIADCNLPMGEILSKIGEIKDHKEILVCCKSGKRSKAVAYQLSNKMENNQILTLEGGLTAYYEQENE